MSALLQLDIVLHRRRVEGILVTFSCTFEAFLQQMVLSQ